MISRCGELRECLRFFSGFMRVLGDFGVLLKSVVVVVDVGLRFCVWTRLFSRSVVLRSVITLVV